MPDINSDIQYLKGVGPAYAKKFARLGIYTIRDLLLHYPRRYIDYSQPYTVVSAPFDVLRKGNGAAAGPGPAH